MIRITYLSREAAAMTADQVLALINQCHRNNPSKGLTGMLLYGNGTFLQVLEGETAIVDSLIGAIALDPRHTDMKIISRDAIDARHYADWSMGFERVTDRMLEGIPGLHNFGLRDFNPEYLSDHGDVVDTLLERHRAPHWDPLIRELDARDKLIAEMRRELSRERSRSEMAALVLETIIEVAKNEQLDDSRLEFCRSALRRLR
jgi:hypothetical protein